ncbi:MAG TPA: hypothetical protein VLG47_02825 [Candidatus Saccharimonadales bacterium]|nr:hypothetical protein [Candidatus Saccharimonadales bacterium]
MNPSSPEAQFPNGVPPPVPVPGGPPPQAIQPHGPTGTGQEPTYSQVMHREVAGHPAGPAAAPAVNPKAAHPNSTQNTLQIAEIRDGVVIMSDGSFRSVIMAKSINFDLMSGQEQEAVEYSYQGFLNSLYFPIQIFVRSQKVDLQPYLEKLDKIRTEHENMLLALLMEDYIDYMDQLSQQTNIMDKKFYIVVPYFPTPGDTKAALANSKNFFSGVADLFSSKEAHVVINEQTLEKAKTELRNRVQAVLGGLMQCNIKALPLDTQELIELYYDTYNPDTATRQQLKNFNDLTADVITKGQGSAPQAHLQRELQ